MAIRSRMSVAARLAAAFAVYAAILIGLLLFHVGTIRETVRTGHTLAETSSRLYVSAIEQVSRIAQLEENVSKYAVTADSGYLRKFEQISAEFTAALAHLETLPLDVRERRELAGVGAAWSDFTARTQPILDGAIEPATLPDTALALASLFVALDERTRTLEQASQAVMADRLAGSADAAARAERISWAAAALALLLGILVPGLLVRSISRELHALKAGTRAVARGDFDYRLPPGSTREFAQLASDFNTMTRRLGELDSMQREFLSRVSHDLKTPLASMRETVNVLLDEVAAPLTPEQRTLLLLNRESAERLAVMIAKLLNLSSLEAGTPAVLALHDVSAIARAAVRAAAVAGRERSVRVLVHAGHGIIVRCDGERIRQLFDNLLENALKFSPAGGTVGVVVRREEDGQVLISVRDQGPGVPPEIREQIFERFFQAPAGRSVAGRGVGLGLTICREIVHLHGGTIAVEPASGGGSVFRVLLPAAVTSPRPVPEEVFA